MKAAKTSCTIAGIRLDEYWFGELEIADSAEIETHLFECASCGARLRNIADMQAGIRKVTREGRFHAILPPSFLRHLRDRGLEVREYRLHNGGSVACTIAPSDDLVVAHLHASLGEVRRLDICFRNLPDGAEIRMTDVAFDPGTDEIVLVPNSKALRQFGRVSQLVRLVAVDPNCERNIGMYTFNHSPYTA